MAFYPPKFKFKFPTTTILTRAKVPIINSHCCSAVGGSSVSVVDVTKTALLSVPPDFLEAIAMLTGYASRPPSHIRSR